MDKIIENSHYLAVNEDGDPQFILNPGHVYEDAIKKAIENHLDNDVISLKTEWCGNYCHNATAEIIEDDENYTRVFNLQPIADY